MENNIILQLKKILNELNKYPGILGSAIIKKDGEVIVKEMPDYIQDDFVSFLSTIEGFTEMMLLNSKDISHNEIIITGKYERVIGINLGDVSLVVVTTLKANICEILNIIYDIKDDLKDYCDKLLEKPLELPIDIILSAKRKKLGDDVNISILRILRYINLRKYLGVSSDIIMYYFGKELSNVLNFESFEELSDFWKKYKLGEMELVSKDPIKIRIYDCISCAGIPNIGKTLCHFEGGYLEGFMENRFNKRFTFIETHCSGLGNEYCEFKLNKLKRF